MKKTTLIILALALCLLALPFLASAETSGTCGAQGDNLTWSLSDGVLTISGTGAMTNYDRDFSYNPAPWGTGITSVVIENGVTTIGDEAFYGSTALTSITIPSTVVSIGELAFYKCVNLDEVTIPENVTNISSCAFFGCSGLTNLEIPASVTSIGYGLVGGCTSLQSIKVAEANTAYCDVNGIVYSKDKTAIIIYPCGKTDTSYTILDGTNTIGSGAFSQCNALTSVTIPNSVNSMGMCAFEGCSALTSVTIPDDVTMIPYCGFHNCSSLTSVTLPATMTELGFGAFMNCSSLTNIILPGNMTSIGNSAFADCTSLTTATIPANVANIGQNVFKNCPNVTIICAPNSRAKAYAEEYRIPYQDSLPYELSGECGDNLTYFQQGKTLTISGTGDMWNGRGPWDDDITELIVEEGVTHIGDNAFAGCSSLASLSLPNTLISIGNAAFAGCTALTDEDFILPDSVEIIKFQAFYGCTGLTSFTLPAGMDTVNMGPFIGSANLTTITLSARAKKFENVGFMGTEDAPVSLQRFVVPEENEWFIAVDGVLFNKVNENERKLYAYPMGKTGASYVVPDGTIEIRGMAFNTNPNLTSLTIPASVINISDRAFHNPNEQLTIYCYEGSAAHTFAQEKGFKFSLLSDLPVITTQPEDKTVNEGAKATFKVVATGAETHQWYFRKNSTSGWTAIKNETSASYTLTTAAKHNGYQFMCRVKNGAGSVDTDAVTLTVNLKPVITTQPKDKTVNEGAKATFKVVATGAETHQWYFRKNSTSGWTAIKNETSASYTLTTAAKHNGYQFMCRVGNSAGSVDTAAVTLTVNLKPVITTQPKNITVNEGAKATFKVVATGAETHQWYFRKNSTSVWTAIKKGISASYSLTAAAKYNGYQFYCKVENSAGSINTASVTLTVNLKPVITTQPKNTTVNEGSKATFKVVATGAETHQWYFRKNSTSDWTAIKNGTSASYTLTTAAKHNGYQFMCRVKNGAGSVDTDAVALTVNPKPVINTQPKNIAVNEGAKATFKVVATGAETHQWYFRKNSSSDWTAIKNETSASYTLTTAAKHNGYQFMCRVKNSAGSVDSNIATLTVKTKPVITTQPSNQSVKAGKPATFMVVATGAETYQWYYQKPGATKWTALSSKGTSATYSLTTAAKHNGYKFKCEVKNSAGSVESSVVTLTVK